MMMNIWTITARLTKENDFQMTAKGNPVCYNSIAIEEGYNDMKKTFFVDLVVLGKQAEYLSTYGVKGQRVGVSGRCIVEDYERKDGTKGKAIKLIANSIELMDKPKPKTDENPFQKDKIITNDSGEKYPWED